jgi:hypothetical protein
VEKEPLNYEQLSIEEIDALDDMRRIVQLPIMEYERLSQFPPFCLESSGDMSEKFMEMAWESWGDGNELLNYEIPDNFRPYKNLEKQFSKQIADAKKYFEKSNGNKSVAVDMYAEDNPSVEISWSDKF